MLDSDGDDPLLFRAAMGALAAIALGGFGCVAYIVAQQQGWIS